MIIFLLAIVYLVEFTIMIMFVSYCINCNLSFIFVPLLIVPFLIANWIILKIIASYRLKEISNLYGKPINTFNVCSAWHTMQSRNVVIIALYPNTLLIKYILSGQEYIIPKEKLYLCLKDGLNGTVLEFEIETKSAYKKVQFIQESFSSITIQEIAHKINKIYELNIFSNQIDNKY